MNSSVFHQRESQRRTLSQLRECTSSAAEVHPALSLSLSLCLSVRQKIETGGGIAELPKLSNSAFPLLRPSVPPVGSFGTASPAGIIRAFLPFFPSWHSKL